MSRGLGAEQRWLLDYVNSDPAGLWDDGLPASVAMLDAVQARHGNEPTPAQRESLRRAARTLRTRGLLEVWSEGYSPFDGPHERARRTIWMRRRATVAELETALGYWQAQAAAAGPLLYYTGLGKEPTPIKPERDAWAIGERARCEGRIRELQDELERA